MCGCCRPYGQQSCQVRNPVLTSISKVIFQLTFFTRQHLKSVHSRHERCRRCHRGVDEHPEAQCDSNCTAKLRKWPRKYYIDDVELYNRLDIPAQKGKRKDGVEEERWYTYLAIFLCSHFKKPFESIRLDVLKKRYKPCQSYPSCSTSYQTNSSR